MRVRRIGIIGVLDGPLGLRRAAGAVGGFEPIELGGDRIPEGLDLLALDVPLAERSQMISRIAPSGYAGTIVAEMPLAYSAGELEKIDNDAGNLTAWLVNPLRYHVHTSRILDIIEREDDPVTAVFAAWRAKPGELRADMLIQLLDYVRGITGESPIRIEAVNRDDPRVMLGLSRTASGAVAHLEIGEHLPDDHPQPQELVVEVFRRESALHVDAFRQAVTVESGNGLQGVDWSPDTGVAVLRDVLASLDAGRRPPGWLEVERALHGLLPDGALAGLERPA